VANANRALIAWYEYVQSPTGESTSTIHGARIAPDGSILDPGGRPLSDGTKYQDKVQVASDGSGFLVVWKSGYDPDVVRGSLVAADGSVVARDFAIPATSARSSVPSVAFDGSRYLVAWADERDEQSVYGVHVSTAGVVADDETRLTQGSPRSVDSSDRTGLAFNGSKFLLTYLGKGVQGSLLSPDLDIEVDRIGLSAVPNTQGYPQVAWSGENYFVNWVNELEEWTDSSARAVRISTSGRVLDPVALVVSGDDKPFNSTLASNRQNSALFSWSNVQDVRSHWLRMVTSAGVLGEPHELPGVESASYVALAGNGSGYFAVVDNSDTRRVEGYVLDSAGNPGAKIDLVTTGSNTGSNVFAAGSGYVVTFGGPGSQLLPVSADGVPSAPIQLSTELAHPKVATNGEHSLIVWAGIDTQTVYAHRFEAGALVGSPIVLAEQNGKYPSVAWDGTGYYVAWDLEGYTAIQGRSVAVDGTLGDVTVLAETEVSGATLASDGEGQLLLSYIRWLEGAQTRRVTSRLLGRDASTPPEGGGGGEGNVAGSSSTGGSNTGAAGESNIAGTTASGGTSNAGTAGEATTAGTSAAGSGGAPGSSGSSAGGSGGGAGTAGTGGPELPPLPGCSTASGQRANGGLPLWLGAALLGFGLVRRRRALGTAR
jgi:hypothetical protein